LGAGLQLGKKDLVLDLFPRSQGDQIGRFLADWAISLLFLYLKIALVLAPFFPTKVID
jgi:hypothetical protein